MYYYNHNLLKLVIETALENRKEGEHIENRKETRKNRRNTIELWNRS